MTAESGAAEPAATGSAATEAEPEPDRTELGGDPACWLHQVCPECGRFVEDALATQCPRCGASVEEL